MKKKTIISILLLAAFAVSLCACGKQDPPASDKTVVAEAEYESMLEQAKETGWEIFDGVYVTGLSAYTGVYPEDGGNETVESVAAVRLINFSPIHYKYVEFTVYGGKRNYSFFAATLLAGAKMTVLEKSAAPFKDDEIRTCKLNAIEAFEDAPSVHLDALRILYDNQRISVGNKLNRELKNVCIYYKAVNEDGYFGGITYKVNVGNVAKKEIAVADLPTDALSENNIRIVFATYED